MPNENDLSDLVRCGKAVLAEKGGFGVDGLGWYPVPLVDEESAGRGVELGVHSVALKPLG